MDIKIFRNYRKSRASTQQKARAHMIENIIGEATHTTGVIEGQMSKRIKVLCVALLEAVSFITTAIGLMIIASDISPLIAIVWALVIQLLAGFISITSGKRNIIILIVCLVVSTGSDYVCYINAVFPYDIYIEEQYVEYKATYDKAWGRAVQLVQGFESSDNKIDNAIDYVAQNIALLERTYNDTKLEAEKENYETLKRELDEIEEGFVFKAGTAVTFDQEGNPVYTGQYGAIENPKVAPKLLEIQTSYDKIEKLTTMIASLDELKSNFRSLVDSYSNELGGNSTGTDAQRCKEIVKNLLASAQQETNGSPEEAENVVAANDKYQTFSGQFTKLQNDTNILLEQAGFAQFKVEDLSTVKRSNTNYKNIMALELPEFSEIRDTVKEENQSVFDWIFDGFATIIDSDFVASSVDLKKKAEQETNEKYDAFMNEITKSNLLKDDKDLGLLINEMEEAKAGLEYKDALSKAINYLASPEGKYAETYSRVFYAFLADGLVLLIGYSLRRKKKAIYRMKNRHDLIHEEPRLIKEALYNLAAQKLPESEYEIYTVENLIYSLKDFISCFEIESYMNDDSLNMSFSLVCKDEANFNKLNADYKEMIYTLQALKYVKPVSKEQYEFYTLYKKNKAVLENEGIKNQIATLSDDCKEFYYLITTGFSLYFSELLNAFYEHVENEQIREELKRKFEEVKANELI